MGDYRIVIEGVGSHHGISEQCADTHARALVAALKQRGHSVRAARLEATLAVTSEGGAVEHVRAADPEPVDLLRPVITKGDRVRYHYTDGNGERVSRPALVAVVWSETCLNVDVDFAEGDIEVGYGQYPSMGGCRTSVLGRLDGAGGGAHDAPRWTAF